jgi:hypothetical protein
MAIPRRSLADLMTLLPAGFISILPKNPRPKVMEASLFVA